ncbi:MAG: NarL family transcriptional regulator [Candidatus Ryanbacteria bacterium RIFCSPHIGHO2_02_FULL_45_13b]|uniref:NarL family transcriptional regulator n=1 Tax=Candidatus Ryanbacteria bacterium RIFCSPHIGHO2_02_FULL_45_13b TaxID=1802117 RepID=A0A1G2GBB2_9BACT|nr:MAG: NarL family transcriptional regulator [Candidatus Ryanbacteria bacterium RIFCSPHIGHO2_02_FULL_45_13b]
MRVPYAQSVHGKEEIKAVIDVLRGNTALGAKTAEFERRIARLFGKKFGIMVNSGSSANLLAVELMNLPVGSEVITPLLTFSTVVGPLVQKGLIPVFVDVVPGTYIADIDQIEHAISKKTRALFIPSLLGNVPDLKRLRAIADTHKLFLVEDSCDTLGARLSGKPTGIYSDITTTSFYGSHIINGAGGGGMIMVHDKHLAGRAQVLRGWGRASSLLGESKASENLAKRFQTNVDGVPYDAKFVFSEMGYNFLPLELSAAFGLVQLRRLPVFTKVRNASFVRLRKFFSQYEQFFILPDNSPLCKTNWLAFPLTIREDAPFSRRDICTHLEKNDIQTRPVFTGNILRQPAFRAIPHKKAVQQYPTTEHIMRGGFVLGCHQGLSSKQIEYMEDVLEKFLGKYI